MSHAGPAVVRLLAMLLALIAPPPAPDAPLPREPSALADALTTTTRALRAAGWDGSGDVPGATRCSRCTISRCCG